MRASASAPIEGRYFARRTYSIDHQNDDPVYTLSRYEAGQSAKTLAFLNQNDIHYFGSDSVKEYVFDMMVLGCQFSYAG